MRAWSARKVCTRLRKWGWEFLAFACICEYLTCLAVTYKARDTLRSHEVICVHSDKGLELRMKCSALFPSHTISQYPVRDRGGSVSMRLNEGVQTVTRRHHCHLS